MFQSGLDYKGLIKAAIKKMADSSTETPSHMPHDYNRDNMSSPHSQNDHGKNDGSQQSVDLEKTLKMILMKLWQSTSTHNPKNINRGDVDYYQGREHNNNEMFMKMIHSNSNGNKPTGQYNSYPGSHIDNLGQYGKSPGQYGNYHGQYGVNQGQFGDNHGQYGKNPSQLGNNPGQYGNSNHGPYSQPSQYVNNQGLSNPNPGQYGNNPSPFNQNPGQYGNNQGLLYLNQGQYASNPRPFNANPSQNGNNQNAFSQNSGQFSNNPGQYNNNPGPYNSQLQDVRTTTVAPSTTSPTLAALEDQRRKQSIQQGLAVSILYYKKLCRQLLIC